MFCLHHSQWRVKFHSVAWRREKIRNKSFPQGRNNPMSITLALVSKCIQLTFKESSTQHEWVSSDRYQNKCNWGLDSLTKTKFKLYCLAIFTFYAFGRCISLCISQQTDSSTPQKTPYLKLATTYRRGGELELKIQLSVYFAIILAEILHSPDFQDICMTSPLQQILFYQIKWKGNLQNLKIYGPPHINTTLFQVDRSCFHPSIPLSSLYAFLMFAFFFLRLFLEEVVTYF